VGRLANRPVPNPATAGLDAAEKAFHRRFRVANEPLLFECAATLRVDRPAASNSGSTGGSTGGSLLPGYDAPSGASGSGPSGGGASSGGAGLVARRESGRLYVTFAHLWFDAPGVLLLRDEVQVVVPFYTVKAGSLEVANGSMAAWGGVRFRDDAGAAYALSFPSGGLGGLGLHQGDLGKRAADFVAQVFAMFAESQAVRRAAAAAQGTVREAAQEAAQAASPPSDSPGGRSRSQARAAPEAADEEEILRRVERIASASARNANLRATFEASAQQQQAGEANPGSLLGDLLLGKVESLFGKVESAFSAAAAGDHAAPSGGGGAAAGASLLDLDGPDAQPPANGDPFSAFLLAPTPSSAALSTAPAAGQHAAAPAASSAASAAARRGNIEAFLQQAYDDDDDDDDA